MATLTRKEREEIAARRIVNVLNAQGVANLRTLEQKIADAGPNPQRVQQGQGRRRAAGGV